MQVHCHEFHNIINGLLYLIVFHNYYYYQTDSRLIATKSKYYNSKYWPLFTFTQSFLEILETVQQISSIPFAPYNRSDFVHLFQ